MFVFVIMVCFFATMQTDFNGLVWLGAFFIDVTAWENIWKIFKKREQNKNN